MRLFLVALLVLPAVTACRSSKHHDMTIEQLAAELSNPNAEVREDAAKQLGRRGWRAYTAGGKLKELADEDPNEDVRKQADRALERIHRDLDSG